MRKRDGNIIALYYRLQADIREAEELLALTRQRIAGLVRLIESDALVPSAGQRPRGGNTSAGISDPTPRAAEVLHNNLRVFRDDLAKLRREEYRYAGELHEMQCESVRICHAIEQLSPGVQLMIAAKYGRNEPTAKIAENHGITEVTVRVHLCNAADSINNCLSRGELNAC